MHRFLLPLSAALIAVALPAASRAQVPAPQRPVLDAGDPNDAHAYYQWGLQRVAKAPAAAADAFYWAARLDPSWADPLYARRVALILASPRLRDAAVTGDVRVLESAEMLRVDSLLLRAYQINPFLHSRLDVELLRAWFLSRTSGGAMRPTEVYDEAPQADAGDVDRFLTRAMDTADPETRAWHAYSTGRFAQAARLYTGTLGASRHRGYTHAAIARSHFHAGDRAASLRSMRQAIVEFAKRDEKVLQRIYESKALYEHAAGILYEVANEPDSAKAAYGRALAEDLAYWSAHRQLGQLALASGDTATALSELDQAVQLSPSDAALRHLYGRALIQANKVEEAVVQLKQAIAHNADYAAPYFLLGRIYDLAEMPEPAVEYYAGFTKRGRASDQEMALARQRLAALAPAGQAAPAKP